MWWYAYWYLVRGRKTWDVAWVDPAVLENARAKLAKLGPIDGFEPIAGAHPLHVSEILQGAQFLIQFPERKASQRRAPQLEAVMQ
jgi:hypothetical protein